jgi:hypothetical protein
MKCYIPLLMASAQLPVASKCHYWAYTVITQLSHSANLCRVLSRLSHLSHSTALVPTACQLQQKTRTLGSKLGDTKS